jgi:hypothetical protein
MQIERREELVAEQAKFAGAGNGLGTALHGQLAEEAIAVGFDRTCGDDQPRRDLGVRQTCCGQVQDFQFTGAE